MKSVELIAKGYKDLIEYYISLSQIAINHVKTINNTKKLLFRSIRIQHKNLIIIIQIYI